MNEEKSFLKELENDGKVDALETPLNSEAPQEQQEEDGIELKNRAIKRMDAKLRAERESNIALNARLEALSEAQKFREAAPEEYLTSVEKIYGTDSPEAVAATELLKKALSDVKEVAKNEALNAFREEQQKEREMVAKEESTLDGFIEELEDTYNIDLSSRSSANVRKGYFEMLEKMSPKDSDGNVIEYADPHAVWEEYSSKFKKPENRAKDLSARSMVQSGSAESKLQDDATLRFLKDNGIL